MSQHMLSNLYIMFTWIPFSINFWCNFSQHMHPLWDYWHMNIQSGTHFILSSWVRLKKKTTTTKDSSSGREEWQTLCLGLPNLPCYLQNVAFCFTKGSYRWVGFIWNGQWKVSW